MGLDVARSGQVFNRGDGVHGDVVTHGTESVGGKRFDEKLGALINDGETYSKNTDRAFRLTCFAVS